MVHQSWADKQWPQDFMLNALPPTTFPINQGFGPAPSYTGYVPQWLGCMLSSVNSNSNIHCESEKLDPFSFLQKFGKYCPVLIFLLLLQTELNCSNEKGSSFYFSQCRMCLCIVYLLLSVGPGEENEDWTAKFCKVISERLGMATGG